MKLRSVHRVAPILFFFSIAGFAQEPTSAPIRSEQEKHAYLKAMEEADQKIANEVKTHSELIKNLEYLTTRIGPRLTGSPQMQVASEWTLKRFRDYGVDAHLETAHIPHSWSRGSDNTEITSPIDRKIEIRSLGWGKATNGSISGPVKVVQVESLQEFDKYKGQLKGAIVLDGKPKELPSEAEPTENAYDAVIPPSHGLPKPHLPWRDQLKLFKMLAEEAAAAVILDSGKTDNLFNMGGGFHRYLPSDLPIGFITHEDYDQIYRLQQTSPVTLKVDLGGTFSSGPVPVSITVAEIKGTQFPEERVMIGGHLDSWDLGQGASR